MKKTIITSFFCLLILPNIFMVLGINNVIILEEKKQTNRPPHINLKTPVKTLKNLNLFYIKNFGFKNISYKIYNYFKFDLLNESSIPEKIIKGKDNWYFLGNSYENVLNNSLGLNEINNQEIKIANKNIDLLFNKINSTKIPFKLFLTREKHIVYPEKLPFSFPEKQPKYEKLISHWKTKYSVIDTKEVLFQNKKTRKLYHKTDTHWNDFGALISFNHLITNIKKELPLAQKLQLKDYNIINDVIHSNDLTQMLDQPISEKIKRLESTTEIKKIKYQYNNAEGFKITNLSKPYKIIVYHDSFTWALVKYFADSFGEVIFIKDINPSIELINHEKPDLVLLQFVTRRIESNKISKEIIY